MYKAIRFQTVALVADKDLLPTTFSDWEIYISKPGADCKAFPRSELARFTTAVFSRVADGGCAVPENPQELARPGPMGGRGGPRLTETKRWEGRGPSAPPISAWLPWRQI
ncbi:hypothetical protein J6590_012285 [Homalodisca vitripennis]|nr:hypothetical protein J6590_012285 [Homalodisca vitripennis]